MIPLEWSPSIINSLNNILGFDVYEIECLSMDRWSSKYKLLCKQDTYFIKNASGNLEKKDSHLYSEYVNLEYLSETSGLNIPTPLHFISADKEELLLMKYLDPQVRPIANYWEIAGRMLGQLHLHSFEKYGFKIDNFIGSLEQKNLPWTISKEEYYVQYRIEPQVALAYKSGLISTSDRLLFDQFYKTLSGLLSTESPQLIHGDLWSGNLSIANDGQPIFIDAAVSYGIREMDLAMTELFGGFPKEFYDSYHEVYPIPNDYKHSQSLYSLYYLLVHLNLFGTAYYTASMQCIRSFL